MAVPHVCIANQPTIHPGRQPYTQTCFKCGISGHIARDCNYCTYCKKYGHDTWNCEAKLKYELGDKYGPCANDILEGNATDNASQSLVGDGYGTDVSTVTLKMKAIMMIRLETFLKLKKIMALAQKYNPNLIYPHLQVMLHKKITRMKVKFEIAMSIPYAFPTLIQSVLYWEPQTANV